MGLLGPVKKLKLGGPIPCLSGADDIIALDYIM